MARASLFVLAVVCMMDFAMALDHTHVNNALPVGIIASTVYSGSGFTNRNIPAGGSGKLLLSSHIWELAESAVLIPAVLGDRAVF